MTFDRGDLIWLDFNPQKGHEQKGRRPALVISPRDYNELSNCLLVCPITSNLSAWAWKIELPAGQEISGAILVDQIKSVDAEARMAMVVNHRVPDEILADVLARLATLTH